MTEGRQQGFGWLYSHLSGLIAAPDQLQSSILTPSSQFPSAQFVLHLQTFYSSIQPLAYKGTH